MAFGSTLTKTSVVTARGTSRGPRAIVKRADGRRPEPDGHRLPRPRAAPPAVARSLHPQRARRRPASSCEPPGGSAASEIHSSTSRGVDIDPACSERWSAPIIARSSAARTPASRRADLPARVREYYARGRPTDRPRHHPRPSPKWSSTRVRRLNFDPPGLLGRAAGRSPGDELRCWTKTARPRTRPTIGGPSERWPSSSRRAGPTWVSSTPSRSGCPLVDDRAALRMDADLLAIVPLVARAPERRRCCSGHERNFPDWYPARGRGPVDKNHADGAEAAADEGEVLFAGRPAGNSIFPDFLAAFDGVLRLVKLLEFRAMTGKPVSAMVDPLPTVRWCTRSRCPWERKGRVMRRAGARDGDGRTRRRGEDLHDEDWALVLPDPVEPLVRVLAEADSVGAAGWLAVSLRPSSTSFETNSGSPTFNVASTTTTAGSPTSASTEQARPGGRSGPTRAWSRRSARRGAGGPGRARRGIVAPGRPRPGGHPAEGSVFYKEEPVPC